MRISLRPRWVIAENLTYEQCHELIKKIQESRLKQFPEIYGQIEGKAYTTGWSVVAYFHHIDDDYLANTMDYFVEI